MNQKICKLTFSLFIFLFFFYNLPFSAPHISGKHIKGQPKDHVKILPDVSHLRHRGAPASEIAKVLGSIGTKKLAVIIVDFQDQQFSFGWQQDANHTFSKLKEYYSEVSYGKLQLDITFFYSGGSTKTLTGNETPYTMPKQMWWYGRDTDETLSQLIKDALSKVPTVIKSSFDYVMVLHAGYGNESTARYNDHNIWSAYVTWSLPVNGFTDGTIVPEKESNNMSPLGVVCHEFGHQLGLPDLYDTYSGEPVVGKWCLMDAGTWSGYPEGSSPAHLSAWCKDFLGWVDVQIVSTTKYGVKLPYVESTSTTIKIPILTSLSPEKEYFLLEYRKKILFDSSLPGEGLLIWYIDDTIARNPKRLASNSINSGVPRYSIDLIEADGKPSKDGDAGDPFPGSAKITTFSALDYKIVTSDGSNIPLVIYNISFPDGIIVFNVDYQLQLAEISPDNLVIGNNYTTAGKLMLIGFNLTESSEVKICIYDIAGKIVKNFPSNFYPAGEHQIEFRGIDDNGEKLLPGLYFVGAKFGNRVSRVEKFIIKHKE